MGDDHDIGLRISFFIVNNSDCSIDTATATALFYFPVKLRELKFAEADYLSKIIRSYLQKFSHRSGLCAESEKD